jgi:polysaccharide pyruvyl transferase WcaK-like protein
MVRKKILIVGAYGVGNLGDEAILAGTLNLLKANPDLRKKKIIVFSRNPRETKRIHKIKATRRNPVDLLKSSEVIIGGGELFQSLGNMAIKYSLLGLAIKILRKHVVFHAIGVSSNLGRLEKFLTRLSLNVANQITTRDQPSKNRLLKLGVNKTIRVITDPSFYVKPISHKEACSLLEKEGIQFNKTNTRIAITSQYFQNRELNVQIYRVLLGFLKKVLANNSDVQVIFIPFTKHVDKPLDSDIIYGKWLDKQLKTDNFRVIEGNYSPQQMMGIIGLMDVVLSTRFHPLVFGTKMNVSAIGIGVFEKTISFCTQHDIPLVKVNELSKIPYLINNIIKTKR